MRLKYNAPTASHRRVIPNLNPERVESDPEQWVWEVSNNFILDIPDSLARKVMDDFPGQFDEAPPEESVPDQTPVSTRPPRSRDDEAWVGKTDSIDSDN